MVLVPSHSTVSPTEGTQQPSLYVRDLKQMAVPDTSGLVCSDASEAQGSYQKDLTPDVTLKNVKERRDKEQGTQIHPGD